MEFTPRDRQGGGQYWRNGFQSPRRVDRPNHNREWSSWNSSPKTYFNNKPKYQYRGPNARGYQKNNNGYWSGQRNWQNNFRNDYSNGSGRPGWRKPNSAPYNNSKGYQNEENSRWRSSQGRRSSPLRSRENESPRRPAGSPRRPAESPRRGSPPPSDAKRPRLERPPERAGKENELSVRRFYGDSPAAARLAASQQMRPPPSPRKSSEGKALYGGKAQTGGRELHLVPPARPEVDKHAKDPLYIGLPNYGNSCYQNATLQSLLGLRPFLTEMLTLLSGPDGEACRTLRAVAKLMVLRQKALGKSVSSHLNDLRDVFARIDPAFRGTEMQDANEFLLRLLDTIKDEIDASRAPANPVRDNFQYQTVESYMCTKCHESVLKRQENISWFVSVPRRQGSEVPTLQDALRLSMRPDRRELLCQHCKHDECRVTSKISKLPRILILQLNRYVFLGEESKKIRANVEIPKFLSLNEYVSEDVTRPPEWSCRCPALSAFPEEGDEPERPAPASPPPPPGAAEPTESAALPASPAARPAAPPATAAESAAVPAPPPPPAAAPAAAAPPTAELVILDGDGDAKPGRTREDEERELQEAIMRSLEEGEPADVAAAEQARLSEFCVEDDQSLCSVDLAGDNTYRLVGLVSHYGGATHSGHYVSDVYSAARDRWYHYDDRRVSCVTEAEVLGDGHQRNGYIFFYMHKDLCSQVVSAETSGSP